MNEWRYETTWITGAGSGLGRSLALLVAGSGGHLVLSGRSVERLEPVARLCRRTAASVQVLPFDLGVTEDAARIAGQLPRPVDCLINNAGFSQRSRVTDAPADLDERVIAANLLGTIALTKAVLPEMVQRDRGTIAVVSSIAGYAGVPLRSAYCAAKAGQIAYFDTLRAELAHTNLTVVVIVPGFMRTNISNAALTAVGVAHERMDRNQARGIDPDRAARSVLRGIVAGRRRVFVGFPARLWLFLALSRVAPGLLQRILMRKA